MKKRIELTNDFHGTDCVVLVGADKELTLSQVHRAWSKLCGIKECTCGDSAGCRPVQVEQIYQGATRKEDRYKLR